MFLIDGLCSVVHLLITQCANTVYASVNVRYSGFRGAIHHSDITTSTDDPKPPERQ